VRHTEPYLLFYGHEDYQPISAKPALAPAAGAAAAGAGARGSKAAQGTADYMAAGEQLAAQESVKGMH
jgi:hypothetical protein